MDLSEKEFASLLEKCLLDEATQEEEHAIVASATANPRHHDLLVESVALDSAIVFRRADHEGFAHNLAMEVTQKGKSQRFSATMMKRIKKAAAIHSSQSISKKKFLKNTINFFRLITVAASLLVVAGIVIYQNINHDGNKFHDNDSFKDICAVAKKVSGKVLCYRNGISSFLKSGEYIHLGDTLHTYNNSNATISYLNEKTLVNMKEGTKLAIVKNSRAKRFHLIAGTIYCEVDHQKHPLTIKTEGHIVKVMGTRFLLRSWNQSTYLHVEEGLVEFTQLSNNQSVYVKQGMYTAAVPGFPLSVRSYADIVKDIVFKINAKNKLQAVRNAKVNQRADVNLSKYGGAKQEAFPEINIYDSGKTLEIKENGWVKLYLGSLEITPDIVLEFDFECKQIGEINGIYFDTNNFYSASYEPYRSIFFCGTQEEGSLFFDLPQLRYEKSKQKIKHYIIPLGKYYKGTFKYMVFINDQDDPTLPPPHSLFSNIRIYRDK